MIDKGTLATVHFFARLVSVRLAYQLLGFILPSPRTRPSYLRFQPLRSVCGSWANQSKYVSHFQNSQCQIPLGAGNPYPTLITSSSCRNLLGGLSTRPFADQKSPVATFVDCPYYHLHNRSRSDQIWVSILSPFPFISLQPQIICRAFPSLSLALRVSKIGSCCDSSSKHDGNR